MEQFHYTWMTTAEYRRRFGYLGFCCPDVTSLFMRVTLDDGIATLDPNVMAPLVELHPGMLGLVPRAVLLIGGCMMTRTLHEHTNAAHLWRRWKRKRGTDGQHDESSGKIDTLTGQWMRIGFLCETLAREAPSVYDYLRTRPYPLPPLLPDSYPADKEESVRQFKAYEAEIEALIRKQRNQDHADMKQAIENMLDFIPRSVKPGVND
jgi:hypothetical protein